VRYYAALKVPPEAWIDEYYIRWRMEHPGGKVDKWNWPFLIKAKA
jgi:hypothetical protein